jgi:hypothetical protein
MATPTTAEFQSIWQAFASLNTQFGLITSQRNLLLAHYTSVSTIEVILRNNEAGSPIRCT